MAEREKGERVGVACWNCAVLSLYGGTRQEGRENAVLRKEDARVICLWGLWTPWQGFCP